MALRHSLVPLPVCVLSGAGIMFMLIWLAHHVNLLLTPAPQQMSLTTFFELGLLSGAGIGLVSWVGLAIGWRRRRRAGRSPGTRSRGAYLRGVRLSLPLFLLLGTFYGLAVAVPERLVPPPFLLTGFGAALFTVLGYVGVVGAAALVPAVSGLLAGAQPSPTPGRTLLGGLRLGVCGGAAFLLPAILLIQLVEIPPPCAQTTPPTCGFFYFGPTIIIIFLSWLVAWSALLVGISSGVAASLGVLVAQRTERRWAPISR